jgi:hypothetical protein
MYVFADSDDHFESEDGLEVVNMAHAKPIDCANTVCYSITVFVLLCCLGKRYRCRPAKKLGEIGDG